jgi:exonuclease SbcC
VLVAQRDEAMQQSKELPALDATIAAIEDEGKSVDALATGADLLAEQQSALQATLATLRADEQALIRTKREVEAQLETLRGADAMVVQCPVCQSPLTPEAAEGLRDELCVTLEQTSVRLGNICRAIGNAEADMSRLSGEEKELRQRIRTKSEHLQHERARTEVLRERASSASARVRTITSELEQLRRQTEQSSIKSETRRQLDTIARERRALAYDAAKHRAAARRVEQLRDYESRHRELTAGVIRQDANLPARDRQEALVQSLNQRLDAGRERLRCLRQTLADHGDPRGRIDVVSGQLAAIDQRRADLDRQIGGIEAQVRECDAMRRDEAETADALAAARRDEAIYADLVVAFGRNGVQAFLIDAVVPEIEAEANRLLDLMSGGEMSIRLHTQRETRAGDLAETLDLVIADRFGPRDYEMYSGGEAFRINLALRIALAKLLARRAGAPLSTLIIDEGFGSQDAGGRDRIVEAVSAIGAGFRCLLVVTHIEELKQQFDTRIEVRKGERGSVAEVVRV